MQHKTPQLCAGSRTPSMNHFSIRASSCARQAMHGWWPSQAWGAAVSTCIMAECGHGPSAACEPEPRQNRCERAKVW